MEGFTIVLVIIFGILSLILFIKMWVMCNNVKKILHKMEAETKYKYAVNTSSEIFNSEMASARELIFCGKIEEAKCELKRILYQFTYERKEWKECPERFGSSYIEAMNRRAERVIELLESTGETIDNKEDFIIPINK